MLVHREFDFTKDVFTQECLGKDAQEDSLEFKMRRKDRKWELLRDSRINKSCEREKNWRSKNSGHHWNLRKAGVVGNKSVIQLQQLVAELISRMERYWRRPVRETETPGHQKTSTHITGTARIKNGTEHGCWWGQESGSTNEQWDCVCDGLITAESEPWVLEIRKLWPGGMVSVNSP